jgi:CRP-like cAMP-binding protein
MPIAPGHYMNALHIPIAHLLDTIGRLAYFKGWRADQLARVAAEAHQVALAKNERLAAKGGLLDALYVVISGQMRLFIPLPSNMERVIRLVGQGESLGESCVLLGDPCPYDIIASKASHLLRIDALTYRRELRTDPVLTERTLLLLARRLLDTLRETEICAQRTGVQKVACYLLQFRPQGAETQFEMRLPARKRDIAGQLGLSQETFSRVLAFLVRQGAIHMKGNLIRVNNAAGLATLNPTGCYREPEACEKLIQVNAPVG